MATKTFRVKCWKDDQSFYYPDGQTRVVSCNHKIMEWNMGITVNGEITPLPNTVSLPGANPSDTDWQQQTARVSPSSVFPSPTEFGDAGYVAVCHVKDLDTQISYYLDQSDYTTQVSHCNDCCIPAEGDCPIVTGLSAGTPGTTTATITWTASVGAPAGYEYIVNTSSTAPVINGTFVGTNTVDLTGLSSGTTYHFWIKTLCSAGNLSEWTSFTFTTAS